MGQKGFSPITESQVKRYFHSRRRTLHILKVIRQSLRRPFEAFTIEEFRLLYENRPKTFGQLARFLKSGIRAIAPKGIPCFLMTREVMVGGLQVANARGEMFLIPAIDFLKFFASSTKGERKAAIQLTNTFFERRLGRCQNQSSTTG